MCNCYRVGKFHCFPREKFQIRTRYSMEQVQTILCDHIAPGRYDGKEFYGKQYEDSFQVSPVTFWKFNSRTVLRGDLVQERDGVVIEVTARMHLFLRIWMVCCVILLPILYVLGFSLETVVYSLPFWLGLGLFMALFKWEVSIAKRNLSEIFGCPIEIAE